MQTIVLKFGGAAMATPEKITHVARLIIEKKRCVDRVVVVVSAMGSTTDQLIQLAQSVHPEPPQREYDMLISVGERISMALLAMALCRDAQMAVSLTGSQSGIMTTDCHSNALILDVRPHRIVDVLSRGDVAIVAGFQGVCHKNKEITTLGRGGSDTTAVALALALGATWVEFFKDVPGVFEKDPKLHPHLVPYSEMVYEEALSIVNQGARVLHPRAIALAQANALPLRVRSFSDLAAPGTLIHEPRLSRPAQPIYEGVR